MLIHRWATTTDFYKKRIEELIVRYWKDENFKPMECFSIN